MRKPMTDKEIRDRLIAFADEVGIQIQRTRVYRMNEMYVDRQNQMIVASATFFNPLGSAELLEAILLSHAIGTLMTCRPQPYAPEEYYEDQVAGWDMAERVWRHFFGEPPELWWAVRRKFIRSWGMLAKPSKIR